MFFMIVSNTRTLPKREGWFIWKMILRKDWEEGRMEKKDKSMPRVWWLLGTTGVIWLITLELCRGQLNKLRWSIGSWLVNTMASVLHCQILLFDLSIQHALAASCIDWVNSLEVRWSPQGQRQKGTWGWKLQGCARTSGRSCRWPHTWAWIDRHWATWSGVSIPSGFADVTSAHSEASLVPKQLDAVVSEVQFKKENLWKRVESHSCGCARLLTGLLGTASIPPGD